RESAVPVVMLPFSTKSYVVGAFLPADIVIGLIAIQVTALRSRIVVAEPQVTAVDEYFRSTKPDTPNVRGWTIACSRRIARIDDPLKIEPKVVDQRRPQYRRKAALDVVVVVVVDAPVRRQRVFRGRRERVVVVVTVTGEDSMLVGQLDIDSSVG